MNALQTTNAKLLLGLTDFMNVYQASPSGRKFPKNSKRFLQLGAVFICSLTICLATSAEAANQSATDTAKLIEQGRKIYLEGVLPSGESLTALRFGKTKISGSMAACASCHRPSGMGSVEGDIQVPPITGNYLFGKGVERNVATMDPKVSKRFNQAHEPYTDAALAYAITHGTNNMGRDMNLLMPHYKLSKTEMQALIAYLKQLTIHWSPGITEDSIRLGMVITPDVEPTRRKVLIDMMRIAVTQKNGSTMTAKRTGTKRQHMISAAEMILGTERVWELDVWELQGAPETWRGQLLSLHKNKPVFALVSGLSNSTWQPVHDFCDSENVPCWFPSVDLPPQKQDLHSLYFSRGVALEADLLAKHLLSQSNPPAKVVQILRDEVVPQAAAGYLAKALQGSKINVENSILKNELAPVDALRQVLDSVKADEAVMLWLRPSDVAALVNIRPLARVTPYFSTFLSNGEQGPFPVDWKKNSRLVYPYELPEQRELHLAYFHAWLHMRKLPLIDEAMQSEAFFALNYLSDTISEMLGNMYGDYLIERAESMLNRREGNKAVQESKDRLFLGKPGELVGKYGPHTIEEGSRIKITGKEEVVGQTQGGTTIYPRLSLGPGQRFASKGGYIVRFADQRGNGLVAETEWLVP